MIVLTFDKATATAMVTARPDSALHPRITEPRASAQDLMGKELRFSAQGLVVEGLRSEGLSEGPG